MTKLRNHTTSVKPRARRFCFLKLPYLCNKNMLNSSAKANSMRSMRGALILDFPSSIVHFHCRCRRVSFKNFSNYAKIIKFVYDLTGCVLNIRKVCNFNFANTRSLNFSARQDGVQAMESLRKLKTLKKLKLMFTTSRRTKRLKSPDCDLVEVKPYLVQYYI